MDTRSDRGAEERLREMGITVPTLPPAQGRYVPAVRTGNLVFCSGQGPYTEGIMKFTGRVGDTLTVENGRDAARICALNCLAEIRSVIGSLDKIRRVVSVRGFVNSADSFFEQPKVMDGASQLLVDVFGNAGRHARCALGTSVLPQNIAVEVEMVVEVVD
jgi:enamine deaminase RidA (YjgF/YER057c/UK114 family)